VSRGQENWVMKRFNLSEWAITHQPLVLFMILLFGAAGLFSYFNLGRAEDPSFTIKTMIVNVAWPGATAAEMQTQVADKIEKKLQDLPYLDRVQSYSQPGVSFIQVFLTDNTPPAKVKDLWYQVRKKVGDIRGDLPTGIIGPNFNDEYGDVYSVIYMLTADGLSLAELKARAEDIRQTLLRVPDVNKVDIIGERPQKIFIEFSHAKLATLGITPQQIFDSVAKQNAVVSGGSVDTSADRINVRSPAHSPAPKPSPPCRCRPTGGYSGSATSSRSTVATRTRRPSSSAKAASLPRAWRLNGGRCKHHHAWREP
jgi:multidrug efflux pump subunit AcrB